MAERGDLLLVFNFHVSADYQDYLVACPQPGTWRCVLDSDQEPFGGKSRIGLGTDHFTAPEAPDTWVGPYKQDKRACALRVRSPPRSMQAYARVVDAAQPRLEKQQAATAEPQAAAAVAATAVPAAAAAASEAASMEAAEAPAAKA